MKKVFLFAIFASLMISSEVFSQASATASATATIVTPISITKTVDMNFGNVAVTSNGGTVVLATNSTRTLTGGVTLPNVTGTVTAASFTVNGTADYTYAITLPSSATTIYNANLETMSVDGWASTPSATGTLDGTGAQTLNVGATLHVAAGQQEGVYTSSTPFTVTVNYN